VADMLFPGADKKIDCQENKLIAFIVCRLCDASEENDAGKLHYCLHGFKV